MMGYPGCVDCRGLGEGVTVFEVLRSGQGGVLSGLAVMVV